MKVKILFIILLVLLVLVSCEKKSTTSPIPTVLTPVISPVGGTYTTAQTVSISCATSGATIRYTTNGSDPTESSTIYSNPFQISSSTTLKARAFKEELMPSQVAVTVYTVAHPQYFEWCHIPAGDYTYGINNSIQTIDYDYYIMKYEVTNAQYLAYLNEALASGSIWVSGSDVQGHFTGDIYHSAGTKSFYYLGWYLRHNESRFSYRNNQFVLNVPSGFTVEDYMNHPVVFVTWFGAWHFAQHYGLRLPTEREWEKAARGMTGYKYPFGNDISGDRANYKNSGDPWDNGTTPVGYYNGINPNTIDSPSPYGVYDMAGNVLNWTSRFLTLDGQNHFVLRGGSWYDPVYMSVYLHSWYSHFFSPNSSSLDIGLRCIVTYR